MCAASWATTLNIVCHLPLLAMADTPNPVDPSKDPANQDPNKDPNASPASNGDKGNDEVPKSWDDFFKHPRTTKALTDASAAKKELEERKKQDAEAERQRQIQAGEHQKVIDDLTPKAKRAEELEAALTTVVEAEMQNIPEARRSLVPDLPPEKKLEWITKNRSFLMDDKKKDVNNPANPASDPNGDNKQVFTLAQVKDPKFYAEHRSEILKAQREGRIRD